MNEVEFVMEAQKPPSVPGSRRDYSHVSRKIDVKSFFVTTLKIFFADTSLQFLAQSRVSDQQFIHFEVNCRDTPRARHF